MKLQAHLERPVRIEFPAFDKETHYEEFLSFQIYNDQLLEYTLQKFHQP
jgi:hypothetical protein